MKTFTILIIGASFLISGCGSTRWAVIDEPTPYVSAGKLAVSKEREVWNPIIPMGSETERIWSTGIFSKLEQQDVEWEIEDYLLETQYYAELERSAGSIGNYRQSGESVNQKINKHHLYLVSLNPIIVVMVPTDDPFKYPYPLGYVLIPSILKEPIYSGIEIPFNSNSLWFTPSQKGEPKELAESTSDTYEIVLDNCHLKFSKVGVSLRIERIK